jgi:hypothetical protein
MLAAHPEVVSINSETHLFSHGVAPLLERFHHGASDSTTTGAVYMDPGRLHEALRRFCDEVFVAQAGIAAERAPRILERTPLHVHHLDLIGHLYPDARVVHIIRDGCDVARSQTVQAWGPATIVEAAREWATAIRDARSASVPHYHEVRYEELLRDPVEGVGELFEWLELPAGDEVRSAIAREAGVVFNVSRGHPGISAGKWRSQLTPEDREALAQEAGDVLQELGYPLPEVAAAQAIAPATEPSALRSRIGRARTMIVHPPKLARGPKAAAPTLDFSIYTSQRYMALLGTAVDQFLQAVALRRYDDLGRLLAADAEIVVSDRGQRRSLHGEAGVKELIAAFAADEPHRARMVRDDCIKHGVGATVIQTQAGIDGTLSETSYVFGAEWVEPDVVLSKVLYRRPSV